MFESNQVLPRVSVTAGWLVLDVCFLLFSLFFSLKGKSTALQTHLQPFITII